MGFVQNSVRSVVKTSFRLFLFIPFFSRVEGLLQKVFYLPVGAAELVVSPGFYLLQHFRINAQNKGFFIGHNNFNALRLPVAGVKPPCGYRLT